MAHSPVIARAAQALHVMEAMDSQDPQYFADSFVARIEVTAEEATGLPREDILVEAQFVRRTDEWFELEADLGAGPEDPRPALSAHPIDPERVLRNIELLSTTRVPEVLHGRVTATAPRRTTVTNEALIRDYAELLAGVMHLRRTVWPYA